MALNLSLGVEEGSGSRTIATFSNTIQQQEYAAMNNLRFAVIEAVDHYSGRLKIL